LAVRKNEIAMASISIDFTIYKTINIFYAAFTENRLDAEAHLVVFELYK
jgi:hypothetical protein